MKLPAGSHHALFASKSMNRAAKKYANRLGDLRIIDTSTQGHSPRKVQPSIACALCAMLPSIKLYLMWAWSFLSRSPA